MGVTKVQTESEKRVWKLLILKVRLFVLPPPRVFCKKSLDLHDNKGDDFFGDDKDSATV
jgi:hypothetical protein